MITSMISFFHTYSLICTCFIGFFIMIFISPIETVYLLILISIYYVYDKNYKNIFIIWFFFFSSWYCVFTFLLIGFEGKILIGGEYTGHLIHFLSPIYSKFFFLERFCLTTIIIFDLLSVKLGFPIYIPSLFKGLLALVEFIFGKGGDGKASCSPEDKPKKSSSPYPSPGTTPSDINYKTKPFFSSSKCPDPSPSKGPDPSSSEPKDFYDNCKVLRDEIHKSRKWTDSVNYTIGKHDGEDVVAYEVRIPIANKILFQGCHKGKDPKV